MFRHLLLCLKNPDTVDKTAYKRRITFYPHILKTGKPVCVCDDGVDRLNGLLDAMLKRRGWADKFSRYYLSECLRDLLVIAFDEANAPTSERRFTDLITELDAYNTEYIIYIPVIGFVLQVSTLRLGNVTFSFMNDRRLTAVVHNRVTHLTHLFSQPPYQQERMSRATVTHLEKSRLGDLKDKVCAEYRAVGDPHFVGERAQRETRLALEALSFGLLGSRVGEAQFIGLEGEVVDDRRSVFAIAADGQRGIDTSLAVGKMGNYQITRRNWALLKKHGLGGLSLILA